MQAVTAPARPAPPPGATCSGAWRGRARSGRRRPGRGRGRGTWAGPPPVTRFCSRPRVSDTWSRSWTRGRRVMRFWRLTTLHLMRELILSATSGAKLVISHGNQSYKLHNNDHNLQRNESILGSKFKSNLAFLDRELF